jgi:hypothetical protein
MYGSHLTVSRFLAPYGEAGTDADAEHWYPSTLCRPVAHATGMAGDVFLCHPFIIKRGRPRVPVYRPGRTGFATGGNQG